MIDEKTDHIYNIILSIVLGIILVLLFDSLFIKPRVINIYMDKPKKKSNKVRNN